MEQLQKATIVVTSENGTKIIELIEFQYNPTEISLDKGVQISEISIPGLDAPLQQFVRGQTEKMTLDIFFDTTDKGMGAQATSVTTETDKIYSLTKIDPERHAPPVCTFYWGMEFPGGALLAISGNQKRAAFQCIVESVRQKFTLFSPGGIPLRATLSVTLREYKTLDEQLKQLGLSSPDRTHSHVVEGRDTLSSIAHRYYRNAGEWRIIADENGIDDPRRINTGKFLKIPRFD